MSLKIKTFLKIHWQFILAFILVIWAFHRWFGAGMITWGDWWPESIDSYLGWLKPNLWSNSKELGMNMLKEFSAPVWIPSFMTAGWLAHLFNFKYEWIEKIIWYWPYVFVAPISFYYFWKTFFPKNSHGTLAGILFFTINTYSMLLTMGGQVNMAVVYALTPAVLALLKRYVETKNIRTGVLLGLLVTLAISYEVRGVMLMTMLVILFLVFFWKKIGFKTVVLSLLWYFSIPILLNMWWIIPFVFQKQTELLPATYDQAKWVVESSYADFAHAITLFHPQWYDNVLGKINPIPPLFSLIPLILIPSILWSKREPFIKFFTLVAIVSIFLAKGANEPFGVIYIEFFKHVPGFSAFRDPSKFNVFLALAYSTLFAFLVDQVYRLIAQNKIWRNLAFVILSIMPIIWLWPVYNQKIDGTFNLIQKPTKAYQEFTDALINDHNFSRTLWLPKKQRFAYFSELHPRISLDSEIHSSLYYLKNKAQETQDALTHPLSEYLLQDAGVKYVVVPDDDTQDIYKDYHSKEFYQNLASQTPWLSKRTDLKLSVYEIKNPEDIVYVRNNWFFVNTFDTDLVSDYLKKQNEKLGLVLSDYKNAPEVSQPVSKDMPYLFLLRIPDQVEQVANGKDLVNQNHLANIQEIDLNILRNEPSTFFIPKENIDSFEWLKIDNDLVSLDTKETSPWNPNFYEIRIPAYEVGWHKLYLKAKVGENLFTDGQIDADFDPQSQYCVSTSMNEILSNTQTVPGGFDGGQFLKMHSLANPSCFSRYIKIPNNKTNFHLEFDYQYKFGEHPIVKVVESGGVNHILNLKDFYPQPENQSNRWHHFEQFIALAPGTKTVTVSLNMEPAPNFNQVGASESWFDNVQFYPNSINPHEFIYWGNLFQIQSNLDPSTVAIKKISNGQFQATISGTKNPQIVILNTMFNPDWSATTSDKSVPTHLKVNGFANGFIVPDKEGTYKINLDFSLMSRVPLGLAISLTALVALIAILIFSKITNLKQTKNEK